MALRNGFGFIEQFMVGLRRCNAAHCGETVCHASLRTGSQWHGFVTQSVILYANSVNNAVIARSAATWQSVSPAFEECHCPWGNYFDKLKLWLSAFISTYNEMTTRAVVILSERSESKDLGTKFTANLHEMRRSFDFGFASAQDDISLLCAVCFFAY